MNHFEKKDFLTTIFQLSDALGTISTLLEKHEQTKTHFRASLKKHLLQHSTHTHDEAIIALVRLFGKQTIRKDLVKGNYLAQDIYGNISIYDGTTFKKTFHRMK